MGEVGEVNGTNAVMKYQENFVEILLYYTSIIKKYNISKYAQFILKKY
jgi:hypothetical protein